jgi:hypothetical protein
MGRGILLWLLGVPIPIIILLALFFSLDSGVIRPPEANSDEPNALSHEEHVDRTTVVTSVVR